MAKVSEETELRSDELSQSAKVWEERLLPCSSSRMSRSVGRI